MQQYFIKERAEIGQSISFDEEQSHHMMHVVRMKKDDIVRIADSSHRLFHVRIDIQKAGVCGQVIEELVDRTRASVEVTLIQGMIKGEKWDFLIQKACELGVSKIVPLISQRSVVKIPREKLDKKLSRWNKIALEACEQCKRSTRAEVLPPISLQEIAAYRSDVNLIAYEKADAASEKLYHVLSSHPHPSSVTCVIGSEGGFAQEEVQILMKQEFCRISLGYRILRAETAALSLLNTIDFYYDMIGDKNDKS